MWWWIEPLFETGVVCLILAVPVMIGAMETDSTFLSVIGLILLLPTISAALCSLAWVCYHIWS